MLRWCSVTAPPLWLGVVDFELAENHGLSRQRLARARRLVEENEDEIRRAWKGHFSR
jgi:hypothetical protein